MKRIALSFNRISHILSFKLFELSSENTTHSLSFCLCRENVDRCRQNDCIIIENVSRDHDYKHQWLRLISFGMKNNWKMWGEHRLYVCWQAGVMSWQNFTVFGSDQWLSFTVPSSNNLFLSMFLFWNLELSRFCVATEFFLVSATDATYNIKFIKSSEGLDGFGFVYWVELTVQKLFVSESMSLTATYLPHEGFYITLEDQ